MTNPTPKDVTNPGPTEPDADRVATDEELADLRSLAEESTARARVLEEAGEHVGGMDHLISPVQMLEILNRLTAETARAGRAEAQLLEMATMVADYMNGDEPTDERQAEAESIIAELDFTHPSTDVADPTPEAPDAD